MATGTVKLLDGDPLDVLRGPESAHFDSIELVERLVAAGASRLTAKRIVEIDRGTGEPGRARPHPISRARG